MLLKTLTNADKIKLATFNIDDFIEIRVVIFIQWTTELVKIIIVVLIVQCKEDSILQDTENVCDAIPDWFEDEIDELKENQGAYC